MAITERKMIAARTRAQTLINHIPKASSATYDRRTGLVCIKLSNEVLIGIPASKTQGIDSATASDLSEIQISPSGYGIEFPKIDVDLYLPALLEGVLGTKAWMSDRGKKGGQAATTAKQAASRLNGKLGGRPKKLEKLNTGSARKVA